MRASAADGAFCAHKGTPGVLPGAPSGPLAGLRLAAKDLFDVAGYACCCGNPDWLATHGPAAATASAVTRLMSAGATLVGKTITDELAYGIVGQNHWYGAPPNPASPDRFSGGSSSGSASAVAGGGADIALGTDTGGSTRVPASWTGIFGIRPTHGAIPLDGVFPLARSFDTCGWFARDAVALRRVGRILLPETPADRPMSATAVEELWALADDPVRRALEPMLAALGAVTGLGRRRDPFFDAWEGREWFRILQGSEIRSLHGRWLRDAHPRFGPGVAERVGALPGITPDQAASAAIHRQAVRDHLLASYQRQLIVLPTTPTRAPRRSATAQELDATRSRVISCTSVASLAGLPQVSIPAGTVDGAPVALSLIGPPGADHALLDLAVRLTT